MLGIKLKKFIRACAKTTGGVAKIWLFDRDDFNFTQGADEADGSKAKYSAIELRDGADPEQGALLYPVSFELKTAEYRYTQSLTGSSAKYEHVVEFLMPDLDHFITQWNDFVDAAAACNGIGMIVRLNSNKILVLGEKWVNDEEILPFQMKQNGSTGTSGKLFEDPNGQTTLITGDFSRGAYEYSGSVSSLTDLEEAGS